MNRPPFNRPLLTRITGKLAIIGLYLAIFITCLYLPSFLGMFARKQSINVCVFSETFAPEAIARFERETGIKVNMTYAEIDEQIYAKFRMNGADGYDVVNVSDYVVHALKNHDMLLLLDKAQLANSALLDQRLVGRVYDQENLFSVPHKWYVYGLVYDKIFFSRHPQPSSLDLIFKDPQELVNQGLAPSDYRVCMLDDARDAVCMAGIYLYGKAHDFSDNELDAIQNLLIAQKRWVEAYTLHSSQYFLSSGVTPLALMSSNYMRKIYASTDQFDFALAREGSMLIIENLVIPKVSPKAALAHQFINFMLSDKISTLNSAFYGFASANRMALAAMAQAPHGELLVPDISAFKRLYIPLLPGSLRKRIEDLWLAVSFA